MDIFKSRIKIHLFQLAYFTWLFKCMCECCMLFYVMYHGIGRFFFCSYVTRIFTALASMGQISNICPILILALYKLLLLLSSPSSSSSLLSLSLLIIIIIIIVIIIIIIYHYYSADIKYVRCCMHGIGAGSSAVVISNTWDVICIELGLGHRVRSSAVVISNTWDVICIELGLGRQLWWYQIREMLYA